MNAIIHQLKRQWFLALLIAALIFALLLPAPGLALASGFKHALGIEIATPFIFFLLLLTSVSFDFGELVAGFKKPLPFLLSLCGTYLLLPLFFYWGSLGLLGLDSPLAIGLLVMGAVPTSLASAAIWTRLSGGNAALCVAMIVVSNLVSVLIGPSILQLTCGRALVFPLFEMMQRLSLSVLLPVTLGQIFGTFFKEKRKAWNQPIGVISRCLVVFIVMLSASKAAEKATELEAASSVEKVGAALQNGLSTLLILKLLLICSLSHLAAVGLMELGARLLSFAKPERIATVYVGSQKTLPVGIYILTAFFEGMELGVLALVSYHALQLIIDTVLIGIYNSKPVATRSAKASPA